MSTNCLPLFAFSWKQIETHRLCASLPTQTTAPPETRELTYIETGKSRKLDMWEQEEMPFVPSSVLVPSTEARSNPSSVLPACGDALCY